MDEATRRAYDLLGVEPGADKKAVNVAYRDLTVVWHPDRLPKGNERLARKATQKLKELNAARDRVMAHLKKPTPPKPPKPPPRPSRPKPPKPAKPPKPPQNLDDRMFAAHEEGWRRVIHGGPWHDLPYEHALIRGPGDGQVIAWSVVSPMAFVRRCYDQQRWVTAVGVHGTRWLTVCSRWAGIRGQTFNTHTTAAALQKTVRTNYDDGYGIHAMVLGPNKVSAIAMNQGRAGSENWMRRPNWPKEEIRAQRRQHGEAIADVTGHGQDWMVLTRQVTGWGSQRISHRPDWDSMVQAVKQGWDEGRRITSLARNDHGYAVVATENSGLGQQTLRHAADVSQLRKHCTRYWNEGKVLTHVCNDNEGWVLVFSTHPAWG